MKILYICHEKNINGASKSLLELIDCFIKRDDKVFVLTAYKDGRFVDELNKRNVTVIHRKYYWWADRDNIHLRWLLQKLRWKLWGDRTNERTAENVCKYIAENNIDLVHTNSSVIDLGLRIHRISKAKHILHIREFGDKDFRIIPFINYSDFFEKINEGTDKIICISKAIYDHYCNLDSHKKSVIYNGVSDRNFLENRILDKTPINILIAGRISVEKGQELVVKALGQISDEVLQKIHVFLAGSGKIKIPDEIANRITLLGYVDNMIELRKKMDVEIVASRAEAFGRVTVEAMMSGLIVIGSDSGGTPELIEDGVNGLLFKCGDAKELAMKIEHVVHNMDECIGIAQRGQEFALNNFKIDRCANDVYDMYVELVNEDNTEGKDYS